MSKIAYTAKVASATNFGDSTSLLMVVKTHNGTVINDLFVSKSIRNSHPLAAQLEKGVEVAFEATGRSESPIRTLEGEKTPVYGLSGFEPKSLTLLVPNGPIIREEAAASPESQNRNKGMAARAQDWILSMVKGQAKAK